VVLELAWRPGRLVCGWPTAAVRRIVGDRGHRHPRRPRPAPHGG